MVKHISPFFSRLTTRAIGTLAIAAALLLGSGCTNGLKVHQGQIDYRSGDYVGAMETWQPLADQGYARAQFFVGLLHERGQAVEKNPAEAARWYQLAADQGDPDALNNLGLLYYKGEGVPRDLQQAVALFQLGTDEHSHHARTNLAFMYYHGVVVNQDRKKAAKLFRTSALDGNKRAQHMLGKMHLYADSVPLSSRMGAKWITASAEQGYAPALFELALLYEDGREVGRSDRFARKAYQYAAVQGHRGAQMNLAAMLYERNRDPGDMGQAIHWFEQAAGQGVVQAQYALGRIYAKDGPYRSDSDAVLYLRQAADQGYADAQASLAVFYDEGRGVKQDPRMAYRLYTLAANQGHPRSLCMLGYMNETGRGTVAAADSIAAYQWYRLSADAGYSAAEKHADRLFFALDPVQRNAAERQLSAARIAIKQGLPATTPQSAAGLVEVNTTTD